MNLNDPKYYPIYVIEKEYTWKLEIGFDEEDDMFTLKVDKENFFDLPLQTTLDLEGPQNIRQGYVFLNGV